MCCIPGTADITIMENPGGFQIFQTTIKQVPGSPQDHDQVPGGCHRVSLHQAVVWKSAFTSEYRAEFFPHRITVSAPIRVILHRFLTRYHTLLRFSCAA